jgi:microcystin degradation protein MlrC
MLRAFIDADLESACILYIVDPVSVDACHRAGTGATLRLDIGGHSSADQGPPVSVEAIIESTSNGEFRYSGQMYRGMTSSMGPSALVQHRGVHIALVSAREQPFDTSFAHALGLFPEEMQYIGLKSQAHFRSGYEKWAGTIYVVREPSVHNPRGGSLTYRRARPEIQAGVLEA